MGLIVNVDRLFDIRSNKLKIMKEINTPNYSSFNSVQIEIKESKSFLKVIIGLM